jgi:AsmA protein
MRIAIGVLIGLVLLVAIVLLLPFVIDLNKYQDQYKPLIEQGLNRKVQLEDIRLTIWPRIGARVKGFTVLDDPAFGEGTFASLGSLDVGVKLMPLLGGQVEVEEITLRDPVITVIKNKNGVLNVSTIGRAGVATPQKPSRAPVPSPEGPLRILAMLAVDQVSIDGGKLTYRDLSAAKQTEYVLQDMELLLQSVQLGETPTLHFRTLVQPLNVPVRLDGAFGPLKESADLDAIRFKLAVGKTDAIITGKTAGRNASLNVSAMTINTADLPIALPLRKPVEVSNLEIAAEVQGQEVLLRNASFQVFGGQVAAQGTMTSGPDTPPFTGKLRVQGIQLGPAVGALLKDQLATSGLAFMDLSVQGQGFTMPDLTKSLKGVGHLSVKDGKIERVNLVEEALTVLKVAGIQLDHPKTTVFSTIETDATIDDGAVQLRNFLMDSHDFRATGGGTVGFDQALNLIVNLNLSQDLSTKVAASSPVARVAMKDGRLRLPLTITGTTQAPSYGVDLKALTGRVQEQAKKKAEDTVKGLLKGTIKPEDLKQQGKDFLKELSIP